MNRAIYLPILFLIMSFLACSCMVYKLPKNYFGDTSCDFFYNLLRQSSNNTEYRYGYNSINNKLLESNINNFFNNKNIEYVMAEFNSSKGECAICNNNEEQLLKCNISKMWRIIRGNEMPFDKQQNYDEFIIPGIQINVTFGVRENKIINISNFKSMDTTFVFQHF